jgi:GTP pyrophosphokinase
LGLIHQQWSPVPGRIKDHIAIPKPNFYQSLHTTVLGPEGHPFEIQIRTWDMHKIAEFGIAAHWSYKERGSAPADDSRIAWLRALLDNVEGSSPREFLDSLKVDLYPDEVYSFTPKGDVFSFPRGATVLDFAYRVHTDVGHRCVGGRVNGRWVPLKTELVNGDIVEITTSPQQRPHRDWLRIVVTSRARSKIRSWLKREEKIRAVEVGKRLLDRELRKLGSTLKRSSESEELPRVLSSRGMSKLDDLLAAIGFGKHSPNTIASDLNPADEAPVPEPALRETQPQAAARDGQALEVTGDADFLVYVAKCCNPVPGEEIVGYVTRGKGVAVHSRDCPNVQKLLYHPEREIEVRWASHAGTAPDATSRVAVDMMFEDRPGMLASISQTVSSEGSDILSCKLDTEKDRTGVAAMTLVVRDATQLARIIERLESLSGMLQVERRGYGSRRREMQRV